MDCIDIELGSNSLNLLRSMMAKAACPPIIGMLLKTPGAALNPVAIAPT